MYLPLDGLDVAVVDELPPTVLLLFCLCLISEYSCREQRRSSSSSVKHLVS